MPSQFISRTTSTPNRVRPPATAASVAESAHGTLSLWVRVRSRTPKPVERPERPQRAADRLTALRAHQRRDAAGRHRRLDLLGRRRQREVVRILLHESVDEVDLLEGLGDGEVAGKVARRVHGPELAADAALAQTWEVRGRRVDPSGDVEAVQVATDLEPQLPGEVVVSVDEHQRDDRGRVRTPVDSQRDGHSEVGAGRRPACRPGDAGLHAQRRRLRGAGRPAHRGGLGPRGGRGRRRRRGRQHVRVRRAGQEGLHRRAARGGRPQGARVRARTRAVVAVGCMAERYGEKLASQLPEADAVLGFDSYASMSDHLTTILDGGRVASHTPADRRKLLPLSPAARPGAAYAVSTPGHATSRPGSPTHAYGPPVVRARLDDRPWAPLEDRQRLRPAVLVLRDPDVPWGVPVAASRRGAGRGAVAGRRGRAARSSSSARTPRPTARTSAT